MPGQGHTHGRAGPGEGGHVRCLTRAVCCPGIGGCRLDPGPRMRGVVEEAQQFDREGHDQGAVLLGRDLGDSLQQAQLQGGRIGGHHRVMASWAGTGLTQVSPGARVPGSALPKRKTTPRSH